MRTGAPKNPMSRNGSEPVHPQRASHPQRAAHSWRTKAENKYFLIKKEKFPIAECTFRCRSSFLLQEIQFREKSATPLFCSAELIIRGATMPGRRSRFFFGCPIRPGLDIWLQYRHLLQRRRQFQQPRRLSAYHRIGCLCTCAVLRQCRPERIEHLV